MEQSFQRKYLDRQCNRLIQRKGMTIKMGFITYFMLFGFLSSCTPFNRVETARTRIYSRVQLFCDGIEEVKNKTNRHKNQQPARMLVARLVYAIAIERQHMLI